MQRAAEFLCESCGYDLTGQPLGGVCPECSWPVARSWPGRRRGSPWQRKPGIRSWAATLFLVFTRPSSCWDEFIPAARAAAWLGLINCVLASAIIAASMLAAPLLGLRGVSLGYILFWFHFALALLLLMSGIEYAGLRFFGARRKWRITPGVALCVVGHAAYGWLLLALLCSASGIAVDALMVVRKVQSHYPVRLPGNPVPWDVSTLATAVGCSAVIGIVLFESLVYRGVRAMRFANLPRETSNPDRERC